MLPPIYKSVHRYDTINQGDLDGYAGREDTTHMSIAVGLSGNDGIVLATDSRMMTLTPSGEVITHSDNHKKLWTISNIMAIASVGNIAGWESQIIETFMKHYNGFDYDQLTEEFTICLRNEWDKASSPLIDRIKKHRDFEKNMSVLTYNLIEFILIGYQNNVPLIKRVSFTKGIITLKHIESQNSYVTGAWDIARYWMPKIEHILPSMSLLALKRLATFLIYESGTYLDSIGGDIQMVAMQKNMEIKHILKSEIEQLKEYVIKAMGGNVNTLINKLQEKEQHNAKKES
jgi:hypothetical protein